ncbi:site-2 protease family protein [Streptomyces sp. NPDC093516]|uniref:site-2 protease family protein n=1 Tax=Streptomyces sp. NPDC093516 TaxID=3155304 RepID=UPI003425F2F2
MEESGGRGQPRSGNDESAEHHSGPPTRPTGPATPDGHPVPEQEAVPGPETAEAPSKGSGTAEVPSNGPEAPAVPSDTGTLLGPATAETMPEGRAEPGPSTAEASPGAGPTPGPVADTPAAGTPAADTPAADLPPASQPGGHPDGDIHPDRAYAGDPRTGTPADGPEADRHDPAPGTHRPETEKPHPAPGTTAGGPEGDHNHSAPGGHRPEADQPYPAPGAPDRRLPEPPAAAGTRTGSPTARPLAHSADGKGPAPQRPEPRGGLLMGRPFGVPVYVAPSWFLVAALITWVFGGQLERVLPELGAARYLVSLFFAVAFYASVLVHELAHTVAALRFELPVRRIQLQFFGGVSEIEKEAETPGREFVLAFVGPLLSLVLAGLFYAALQTVDPGTVPGVLLAGLMISNLIVAAFNLLPGLPLDGGRMLRAVVWKLTGKPMTGTIAAAWVGRALAVAVLIGLPLLTQSGALGSDAVDNVGMDTVLDALLAAILAAIIWTGAGNSLRMARLREHLPELRARTLTRRAVPVESDTPLSEALRRANAAGARALVVVDADGRPLSLVREAAIVGVPEHRRPWVAVSGLAQELTEGMRVSAELSGEELLDALRATPATEYLVVEDTGEIYGVLSAADVERAFVKAMARPS